MGGALRRVGSLEWGVRSARAGGSAVAALLFFYVCVVPSMSFAVGSVRTVAITGQNPFTTGEVTGFGSFYSKPSVNNRGEVAFVASLAGGGVPMTQDSGLWVADRSGAFETVGREGMPAPGFPAGSTFITFLDMNFNGVPLDEAGHIAFVGFAGIPASASKGAIWAGDSGGLHLTMMQGGAAPGAAATYVFTSAYRPTLSRDGEVAFQAGLNGSYTSPPNNGGDGVWRGPFDGANQKVALINENAVGLGAAAKFIDIRSGTSPVPINRAGTAAFAAFYTMADGATPTGTGIWAATAQGLELRAWNNMPAPQLGPTAVASVTTFGGVDGATNVAFYGQYGSAAVGGGKGSLIGVAGPSGLDVVAYSGQVAPGTEAGHKFYGFNYEPVINSAGDVAFYGNEIAGDGSLQIKSGLWVRHAGALGLFAREGDVAPGTAGAKFGSFIRDTPAINRFGQVAFLNTLTNVAAGTGTSTLWATDLNGAAVLVARQGETIEVAPGDVRTIQTLSMITFHGDDDGRARSFNDLGQVAFKATFTGGTSGVFLSNAVAHLEGDYNHNGVVDAADYSVWRDCVATHNLAADGNHDQFVDEADYELWRDFFGASLDGTGGAGAASNSSAVPEPGALVLLLSVGVVIGGCVRRRRR